MKTSDAVLLVAEDLRRSAERFATLLLSLEPDDFDPQTLKEPIEAVMRSAGDGCDGNPIVPFYALTSSLCANLEELIFVMRERRAQNASRN